LITFPRGRKTDWGKKRGIFGDLFQSRIDWIDTVMGKAENVDGKEVLRRLTAKYRNYAKVERPGRRRK